MKHLLDMATGRAPADLLISNAKIVNVFTGEIELGCISIGDGKILGFTEIAAKQVLDAQGKYLLPGLIDAHIHLESSMLTPAKFTNLALPHGTTSLVADPHELANVFGIRGIEYVLACSKVLPLNIFVSLSSCVPATALEDAGATLLAADLEAFIDHPRVSGIAEIMNYPGVLFADPDVLAKIDLGLKHHKTLDGHAPGVLGQDLDAYLLTGISNTHECSTATEVIENLRRGSYILIREGSAAKNLHTIIKQVTPANSRFFAFCCDDRHIKDIVQDGHMDNHLRLAVKAGLDPVMAITMCTLNAAQCFKLSSKGAIAPGYDADLILVEDLQDFKVQQVFASGKLVAEHGEMISPCAEIDFDLGGNSVHLAPLTVQDFALYIPSAKARVIGIVNHSLVTEDLVFDIEVDEHKHFKANPNLTKIAVIERHKATGLIGLGILSNYGLQGGAIATTISHDSHNIVVAGDSDADMLLAVQELAKIGGGICLVKGGEVTSLALPLAGLITAAEPKVVDAQLELLHEKAKALQINPQIDPFMTLSFMALPVIPNLKLTPRGLFDVNSFSLVSLYENLPR